MATFSTEKAPDVTQNIIQKIKNLNVSNVTRSDANPKLIQADCKMAGPGSNITYSKSNVTTNYTSSQIRICGKLHNIDDVSYDGELVIRNDPMTNSGAIPPLYMCFLLSSNTNNVANEVDNLFNKESDNITNFNVPVNSDGAKYILYKSSDTNGTPCIVAIFLNPILIKTSLTGYSKSIDWFKVTPSPSPTDYSILKSDSDGDWMECDYVPVDSETVTTYSLPIQSNIIKDSNALDSLRTIIMFVVFFIICVFSYFLIPVIYVAIAGYILKSKLLEGKSNTASDPKKTVLYMDYILTVLLGGLGLILICVGAFSDPKKVENTGDLLLTGFSLSMIYIIGYIVIQSKKLSTCNFIPGANYMGSSCATGQSNNE
jgi:hypothetical protein